MSLHLICYEFALPLLFIRHKTEVKQRLAEKKQIHSEGRAEDNKVRKSLKAHLFAF